jgi:hypothetical protein
MNKQRTDSLTKLADAAFKQAALKVIERAKQTGTPVILWEDGAVKAVPPEELEATVRKNNRKKRLARKQKRQRKRRTGSD